MNGFIFLYSFQTLPEAQEFFLPSQEFPTSEKYLFHLSNKLTLSHSKASKQTTYLECYFEFMKDSKIFHLKHPHSGNRNDKHLNFRKV